MIDRKTSTEIALMQEGGKKLGDILAKLLEFAKPGVSLIEIESLADTLIANEGAVPSFKTVEGYKWATCLCVNEAVVHGIPTPYKVVAGDVLTIDVGLVYEGFHTDTAWTMIVGNPKPEDKDTVVKFLAVGEEALRKSIEQAKIGNRIGHISQAIQKEIESAGYSIIKTLVGHGVGRTLHEEPQIPGMLRGPLENTTELTGGETIAIEVIYAMGDGKIEYDNNDGWTISTKDGSLSAVFEHTIAVTEHGPVVLTWPDRGLPSYKGRQS